MPFEERFNRQLSGQMWCQEGLHVDVARFSGSECECNPCKLVLQKSRSGRCSPKKNNYLRTILTKVVLHISQLLHSFLVRSMMSRLSVVIFKDQQISACLTTKLLLGRYELILCSGNVCFSRRQPMGPL